MSKFCDIDEWETVDVVSEVGCVMGGLGVAMPLAIGFSIFMGGEAASSAVNEKDDPAKPTVPAGPRKKSSGPQNIMNFLEPPKPSWASH